MNVVRYVNAVAEYMDICVDMTAHAHLHRHLGHVYTGGRIDYCMKTLSACLPIRGCGASANCGCDFKPRKDLPSSELYHTCEKFKQRLDGFL